MEAPCACGGTLYAQTLGDIEDAVKRHNRTEQHRNRYEVREPDPAYEGRLNEADADIAAGRVKVYDSTADFLAALKDL